MNLLIIEDENLSALKLKNLLLHNMPGAAVLDILDSVEQSVNWLQQHPAPDLIFMDIELCDGQSFEIFEHVQVTTPVVFTTAYDEFAIKAFKVNSIDYLLKPVKEAELQAALLKFNQLYTGGISANLSRQIRQLSINITRRSRFLVKAGQKFISIELAAIAYFFSEGKVSFFRTWEGRKFIVDYTLDTIEQELDTGNFLRINRQFIAHVGSVKEVHPLFNGKLKIILEPASQEEVIVSREKANALKDWLGR